jgi:hypothetical protein
MSSALRFRSGQVELHRLRVDSGTVLNPGDLVYLDTDDVKPASDLPFDTDLATTRGNFAAVFLGICHQASADGETADVSVDLSPLSVYEYDCDSATFEVGSLLTPDGDGTGLEAARLAKTTTAGVAIARAAEYKAAAATTIRAQFASAFHPASSNVNAAIG